MVFDAPDALDDRQAAAFFFPFHLAHLTLFERARLQPGETVLIHAAAGGVGSATVQLAVDAGARVFATAGTAEKCAACEDLGAERAINYRTEDFPEIIAGLTAGRGVDVILDMVGGAYFERNIQSMALEGRLVIIAFLGGPKANANFLPLMLKRLTVTGSTLRPRSVEQKAEIAAPLRAKVWPLLESGRVRPIIDSTFPLAKAADAHARMESSGHVGKIVLTID